VFTCKTGEPGILGAVRVEGNRRPSNGLPSAPMSEQHPSAAEWRKFVEIGVPADRGHELAAHVGYCASCVRLLCRLRPKLHYVLGRPVASFLGASPSEVEIWIETLRSLCLERMVKGGAVVVAADWPHEGLLLHVLSLTLSRLRRNGVSSVVCGFPNVEAETPSRPEAAVSLLLGASSFSSIDEWRRPVPNQVAILAVAGSSHLDTEPELVISAADRSLAEQRLEVHKARILTALNSGDPFLRGGILCTSLGCDLPPGFFPASRLPSPFALLRDPSSDAPLHWSAVAGGHALSEHTVREFYSSSPQVFCSEVAALLQHLMVLTGCPPSLLNKVEQNASRFMATPESSQCRAHGSPLRRRTKR
jgi:hypothetical protein